MRAVRLLILKELLSCNLTLSITVFSHDDIPDFCLDSLRRRARWLIFVNTKKRILLMIVETDIQMKTRGRMNKDYTYMGYKDFSRLVTKHNQKMFTHM